ncbi:MAG: hypothetical protein MK116_06720 [Phycisphaerales bacterium]|nr:hypothetical protein [Phycisphaerales bacterium]
MSLPDPIHTNVVAVIHRRDGYWACAAGRPLDAGRMHVVDLARIESDTGLQPWLDRVQAESVRMVLPASEVICRTCSLPDGDPDSLEEALRLQAETQLLGTAPAHRLAVGMLPSSGSDATRTGLILAWPESSPWTAPSIEPTPLYVPDVAAIASLLDGKRPADPILWVDPANESLALALAHMQGVQVRALRDDFSGGAAGSVKSVVAETALQADLSIERATEMSTAMSEAFADNTGHLLLPDSVRELTESRLELDTPLEDDWADQYGIALGGLLATSDELVVMTMFQRDLPQIQPTLIEATREQLSSVRIATWLLVASILVFLFAPVVISGIRLGVLRLSHPSLPEKVRANQQQTREYNMYRAMSSDAWPMTKLLADISNSTPIGVKVEKISLTHGELLKIVATASAPTDDENPRPLVTVMKDQLESLGVFNDVVLRWNDETTYGTLPFTIDARVARPLYRPRYGEDRDFGVYTYAERLHGREAMAAAGSAATQDTTTPARPASDVASSQPGTPPVASRPPATPSRPPTTPTRPDTPPATTTPPGAVAQSPPASNGSGFSRRPSGGSSSGDGASMANGDSRAGNTGVAATGRMPEMLTPTQLGTMSTPEIRQQLIDVSQARKKHRGNPEIQQQLQEQFDLLMEELKNRKPQS